MPAIGVCLGLFLPYIWYVKMTALGADVTVYSGLFGQYATANNDNTLSKRAVSCMGESNGCSDDDDKTKYVDYGDFKTGPTSYDNYCDTTGDGDAATAYKNGDDTYKSSVDALCTGRGLYVRSRSFASVSLTQVLRRSSPLCLPSSLLSPQQSGL